MTLPLDDWWIEDLTIDGNDPDVLEMLAVHLSRRPGDWAAWRRLNASTRHLEVARAKRLAGLLAALTRTREAS